MVAGETVAFSTTRDNTSGTELRVGITLSLYTCVKDAIYWDLHAEANGDQYLVDTNLVDDPVYLQTPWITALHFKKEPDASKWDPTPCDARF